MRFRPGCREPMSNRDSCVRWGISSTARINERLIGPLRETDRSQLVAVASRSEEKARNYARQWEIPRCYGSYDELVADPDTDAVYISLPNGLHTEWTVKCAEAGKHVLCEKPLALTLEEMDQIEQSAQRSGVIVQEAAMMCAHPQMNYLQRLVTEGAVGQVRLLRSVFTYVLKDFQDVRMDPSQGGGSLWDLGSYSVRHARRLLQQEPTEVLAAQNLSDRGVDLSFAGQMQFPDGAQSQFFSSLEAFGNIEADVLGTEGSIRISSPWGSQLERVPQVDWIRHDGSPARGDWDDGMLSQTVDTTRYPKDNAYEHQVNRMIASILDGAEPVIPLSDSRQNTRVLLALFESAREGKAVRI